MRDGGGKCLQSNRKDVIHKAEHCSVPWGPFGCQDTRDSMESQLHPYFVRTLKQMCAFVSWLKKNSLQSSLYQRVHLVCERECVVCSCKPIKASSQGPRREGSIPFQDPFSPEIV